jgi:hypothetical protein
LKRLPVAAMESPAEVCPRRVVGRIEAARRSGFFLLHRKQASIADHIPK